jgi:hemolysin III
MTRTKLKDRKLPDYTRKEEIMNMVSHIVGGAIGIAALVLCLIYAVKHHDGYAIAGSIVFGVSMILLYTISSLYHGLKPEMPKKVLQIIDHCTIFVLIAGTYTPILLCSIRRFNEPLAWTLFGIIWGIAILGITLNSIDLKNYKKFSMICYLAMGWCIIFTAPHLVEMLGKGGTSLLIWGGVAYTIGSVFYMIGPKKRYFHFIFHIFVDIGSILHFLCILLYVI